MLGIGGNVVRGGRLCDAGGGLPGACGAEAFGGGGLVEHGLEFGGGGAEAASQDFDQPGLPVDFPEGHGDGFGLGGGTGDGDDPV